MKTELERFYRQQTFLLELSSVVEEEEESPYAWLPPHLWPKPEAPKESAEDRHATHARVFPEDLVKDVEHDGEADYFQALELRQRAMVANGASPTHFQINFTSIEADDFSMAEELSNEVWPHIDPNEADSLFAQGFRVGAFTQDDAAELRDLIVAEVQGWTGDASLVGEIEYLSAAGQMARMAGRKLEEGAEQSDLLGALVERCQEYISYRTEYLSALGLL